MRACLTTEPSWAVCRILCKSPVGQRYRIRHDFGPATKGIPLAATVAVELVRLGRNVPFAYNRKEARTTAKAARWWARPSRAGC